MVQSVNRDSGGTGRAPGPDEEIRGLMARHDGADLHPTSTGTVESLRLDVLRPTPGQDPGERHGACRTGWSWRPSRAASTPWSRWTGLWRVQVPDGAGVRAFRKAEAAMEAHPMAGQGPPQAASIPLNAPPRPKASPLFLVLALRGTAHRRGLAWFTRILAGRRWGADWPCLTAALLLRSQSPCAAADGVDQGLRELVRSAGSGGRLYGAL